MNSTKIIITTFLLLFSATVLFGQKPPKVQTADIKTSAVCGHCEETITEALTYHKGVLAMNMDMETKVVSVRYKTKKTSVEDIRNKIASLGYNADEVKANKDAYAKLSPCCQKPGVCGDDHK